MAENDSSNGEDLHVTYPFSGQSIKVAAPEQTRQKKKSHLLYQANRKDLCQHCSRNKYYLAKLIFVFDVVNAATTVTGVGALIGHVQQQGTHFCLVAIAVWILAGAFGTALCDEHTTKPSARFAMANTFLGLLVLSVISGIAVPAVIFFHLGSEIELQDSETEMYLLTNQISQVVSCEPPDLLSSAQKALRENASMKFSQCRYTMMYVVPTWQTLTIAKWMAYCVTLAGLLVGGIAWLYGAYCYFSRLRAVKQIFANGGHVECVPYRYRTKNSLLVNGHIEEPALEEKLLEYFMDLERREKESLEDFLMSAINTLCQEGQDVSNALCGRIPRT